MKTLPQFVPFPDDAKEFLDRLRDHLENSIDAKEVQDWLAAGKNDNQTGKPVPWEGLFLEKYVLPHIPKYLQESLGLTQKEALTALLAESRVARADRIASSSPSSAQKHLFTKAFGTSVEAVVASWWKESGKSPFSQSCPDFAFGPPCKHTVVFEAKLFRSGSIAAAKAELVRAIYQCFYYRAQPNVAATKKHPAWKYDYACLFAYDASANHSLVDAWNDAILDVKDGCWEASSIFVMVLPDPKVFVSETPSNLLEPSYANRTRNPRSTISRARKDSAEDSPV
jgi:hypothetical protein